MVTIDNKQTGNNYTDATTILDVYNGNGGYFIVAGADVYCQLQYGTLGAEYWTDEVHVPPNNGIIKPGTMGIRFRSYTAGTPATISAAIATQSEPSLEVSSGSITLNPAVLGFQHNDVVVASEANVDFEDGGGVTFTVTDDAANSRVKVAAAVASTTPSVSVLAKVAGWLNSPGPTGGLWSIISGSLASGTTGFDIPGNTMGTTSALRLRLVAYARGVGTSETVTVSVKFGGTTFLSFSQVLNGAGTTSGPYPIYCDLEIHNMGALNKNGILGLFNIPTSTNASGSDNSGNALVIGVQQSILNLVGQGPNAGSSVQAINTANDQKLDCTYQASANASVALQYAILELLA